MRLSSMQPAAAPVAEPIAARAPMPGAEQAHQASNSKAEAATTASKARKAPRIASKHARGFDEIAPSPGLVAKYAIGTMVS